jgi:hypothetical protein
MSGHSSYERLLELGREQGGLTAQDLQPAWTSYRLSSACRMAEAAVRPGISERRHGTDQGSGRTGPNPGPDYAVRT